MIPFDFACYWRGSFSLDGFKSVFGGVHSNYSKLNKDYKKGTSRENFSSEIPFYVLFCCIKDSVYIDDGISGQKLTRDDFQRLLDDVRSGKIDLIIFTRLDRWFRNLRHYLNTQDILDRHSVSWTAVEQPYFDTSTPHGRAFVNNSMIWAELEAQNDSDQYYTIAAIDKSIIHRFISLPLLSAL